MPARNSVSTGGFGPRRTKLHVKNLEERQDLRNGARGSPGESLIGFNCVCNPAMRSIRFGRAHNGQSQRALSSSCRRHTSRQDSGTGSENASLHALKKPSTLHSLEILSFSSLSPSPPLMAAAISSAPLLAARIDILSRAELADMLSRRDDLPPAKRVRLRSAPVALVGSAEPHYTAQQQRALPLLRESDDSVICVAPAGSGELVLVEMAVGVSPFFAPVSDQWTADIRL